MHAKFSIAMIVGAASGWLLTGCGSSESSSHPATSVTPTDANAAAATPSPLPSPAPSSAPGTPVVSTSPSPSPGSAGGCDGKSMAALGTFGGSIDGKSFTIHSGYAWKFVGSEWHNAGYNWDLNIAASNLDDYATMTGVLAVYKHPQLEQQTDTRNLLINIDTTSTPTIKFTQYTADLNNAQTNAHVAFTNPSISNFVESQDRVSGTLSLQTVGGPVAGTFDLLKCLYQ